ncbi:TIR domain-containing protein [Sneathiella sp. CAU 1612]|uniref:TIR domain-containing protein n=1 Tax=Sneathiella sedimenti TaxID=2816034 RepID=A0ABS3F4B9_9PROT|nr:SEFIR domain-containing protein [Sneathiella sedimenti]MBO0333366.1 TIR domain-containing protein [Sneathiella sedimenti]
MAAPKLFISYSWSNVEHEKRVLGLAAGLVESGVDVILDKWDLKEGHDAVAFMEKMVTDKSIKKVAIITDKTYAAKADGRAGGVGTETQIISKEVYDKQNQGKFVAVVMEKDDDGNPFVPTYYKSRIFIDLSEPEIYAENFEKLLRWIFDKPLHVKPELGKKPKFLDEPEDLSLGTTVAFRRAVSAIKDNKPFALGALDEYFTIFSANLENFRLTNVQGEFDDAVVDNIESFIPYRNELIQVLLTIAHYCPAEEYIKKVYRFFELLIPYLSVPKDVGSWKEWDFDNFKFIIHEMFLYTIAIFIKTENYALANYLLNNEYYVSYHSSRGSSVMVKFTEFRNYLRSLDYRNNRLKLNRISVHADLLHERSNGTGIEFNDLIQADFVLLLRGDHDASDSYDRWWPETLVYSERFRGPFEIFSRSKSKSYFALIKPMLGINNIEELRAQLDEYKKGNIKLPSWSYLRLEPTELVGLENLETIP